MASTTRTDPEVEVDQVFADILSLTRLKLTRLLVYVAQTVRASTILKLFVCFIVDIIGFASYLIPGLGELTDIAWAPMQAFFLHYMFGGLLLSGFGFVEEIVPGLDFIPTATIAWTLENVEAPALDGIRGLTGVRLNRGDRWTRP